MSQKPNDILLKYFFNILIKVIGRRSSEQFVISTIDSIIYKYKLKYSFLEHITIHKAIYKENIEVIEINPEINNVKRDLVGKAIDQIFDEFIKSLTENIGYFFIKEIREDLDKEIGPVFAEFNISYLQKQNLYQNILKDLERLKLQGVSNTELFGIIINLLCRIAYNKDIKGFSIDPVLETMNKLQEKYTFLKLITIIEHPQAKGYYFAKINPKIENYDDIERGKIIEKILFDIGKSIDINARRKIINVFREKLSPKELYKINRIGVRFDTIEYALIKEEYEIITSKTFEAIIDILRNKNSSEEVFFMINEILNRSRQRFTILDFVKIDKNKLLSGSEAIEIDPEISKSDSRDFAKAIREVMFKAQDIQNIYDQKEFVEAFKIKIGDNIVSDMNKIGVNLNLFEIRGNQK